MDVTRLEKFAEVLSKIIPPVHCEVYQQLYPLYLEAVGHVTNVLVKSDVLSYDRSHCTGLDCGVARDNLVRDSVETWGSPVVNVISGDHSASAGGACHTALGDSNPVGYDKGPGIASSTRVPGLTKSQRKNRSRRLRRAVGSKDESKRDSKYCGRVSSPVAGSHDIGMDTCEVSQCVRCNPRFASRFRDSRLRRNLTFCERHAAEDKHACQSSSNSDSVVRRTFRTGSRHGSAVDSQSSVSSKSLALESLWEKRHLENKLDIVRYGVALSGDPNTAALQRERECSKKLVYENAVLRACLKDEKQATLKLFNIAVSTSREFPA